MAPIEPGRTERKRKGATWFRLLPAIVLLIVAVAVVFWRNREKGLAETGEMTGPGTTAGLTEPPGGTVSPPGPGKAENGMTDLERRWYRATGVPPRWPEDFDAPKDCEQVVGELRRLCGILDDREYVREWNLPGGVYGLITGAARDLAENRPVVTGELRRFDLLLGNVSHLYLTLGRSRVDRILTLVRREPDMVEPLALQFFRWLQVRGQCARPEDRAPSFRAQYEYAAFFLHTLGGQAYLRRRPARWEALGGFYAVWILDRAIREKRNLYGFLIGKDLERYRQMPAGRELVFADRYRQVLDEIRRRSEKEPTG